MSELPFIRHVIYDNPYYLFRLDEITDNGQRYFQAHLEYRYWSATALKRGHVDWQVFRKAFPFTIFAVCNDGDLDKWKRFVTLFGFEPTGKTILCNCGEHRELYISKVNHGDQHPTAVYAVPDFPVDAAG